MELRNIVNSVFQGRPTENPNKIVHELNNEGCRCDLCQKVVIKENKIIHNYSIVDQESEYSKGVK